MNDTAPDLMFDSGVYESGLGYERLALVHNWNPEDGGHLARLYVRVDKNPSASFARAEAWTPNAGWQVIANIGPVDFWREMPGYLRWANDTSHAKTRQLLDRLYGILTEIAKRGGL